MDEIVSRLFCKDFEKYSLEHKYTIVISILGSFVSVVAFVVNTFLESKTLIIVAGACSIVYIACFFIARYLKYFGLVSWLLIINTIMFSDFTWFYFDGSRGSSLFMLLLLAPFVSLIMKKSERILAIIIILINIGTLVYLEYGYPQLVRPYNSELKRIIDVLVAFCLTSLFLLMFLNSILKYLNREKANAEKADKLKTAFLNNINHEIRTPMNAIVGFVGLLASEGLSGDQQYYCNNIKTATLGLEKLIVNIINIAQIESKQLPVKKVKTDIAKISEYIYAYFKEIMEQGKECKVEFILNMDSARKGDYIKTDQFHLRQILICLIDNALKFTKEGHVEFGYHTQGSHIQFYVKDTGIGIPKDKKGAVFNAFLQADNWSVCEYGGAGLGLTISRGLVRLLGGEIWFESVENKGSTFYFTLPV